MERIGMDREIIQARLESKDPKLTAIVRQRCISARSQLTGSIGISQRESLDLRAAHRPAFVIDNAAGNDTCRLSLCEEGERHNCAEPFHICIDCRTPAWLKFTGFALSVAESESPPSAILS